ncbi:putative B3 domain-containing protein At5g66980, partial [Vigna umbellata]|uniref:putative B3 domain-containing protein At5g66980 n=1 Tax=Vigna umbellata TaxID=87088 RepID=UPI001F5FD860
MSTAAKEYFFKIFSPEKHSETMVIPSSFVKSRGLGRRTIPKDIILRNVSGRVWCVKTRIIGHKIYFGSGWKSFQEENCIRKADFMLFKYDGTNVFKVVILEQSSRCERREVEEDE